MRRVLQQHLEKAGIRVLDNKQKNRAKRESVLTGEVYRMIWQTEHCQIINVVSDPVLFELLPDTGILTIN